MNQPLIQFKDVSKRFGKQIVLKEANFSIYQGEITTLIGKSGEGKSVLLKHIIGLMKPDSGQVLFKGKTLSKMRKRERKALKRKFSYMFQSNALFDSMNVFENVALPLKEGNNLPEATIEGLVREKLQQLDLREIDEKYPSQLSGGMKKRVALARALITDPEIVLFDEPTTGLDPIRKNAVHSMISDYQEKFGFTGLIVSHEIPDIFYISQRIIMLQEGQIIFEGSPAEIQQASDSGVLEFIRGLESRHDHLTGMVPKPQGEDRFREEMGRLQRHQIPFSIIIFTVDNIAEINEKVGHIAAQSMLQNFAVEVQRSLRITDTCSRYGLNKIMMVLPHTDMDQARKTCAKLSKETKISEILKAQISPGFCFSVSTGFAEAEKDSDIEQVLAIAESEQNPLCEFHVC
jgi:phospholipid/cholesterol/gamma-HCH transport system ATP-binding protein